MKAAVMLARISMSVVVAFGAGYWAGSIVSTSFERSVLQEFGVKTLADAPEYQGVAFAQMLYSGIAFLAVAGGTGWGAWKLTGSLFRRRAN